MNTFLLVWNKKRWQWQDLTARISQISREGFTIRDWSCGNTKKIREGDSIYFIRLGMEPKGIFASGTVIKERHLERSWDLTVTHQIWYITVKIDKLLDSETDTILNRKDLNKEIFQPMHWDSQTSGVQIPTKVADNLDEAWKKY